MATTITEPFTEPFTTSSSFTITMIKKIKSPVIHRFAVFNNEAVRRHFSVTGVMDHSSRKARESKCVYGGIYQCCINNKKYLVLNDSEELVTKSIMELGISE